MNIVTFCTCLSVAESNKLYAVSLYHDTLTKDSFVYHGTGILQLLRPHHKALVPILGRQSGYDVTTNKQEQCQQLGHTWHEYQHRPDDHDHGDNDKDHGTTTFHLLADCATYLVLQVVETVDAGDHLLTICRVVDTLAWQPQRQEKEEQEETDGDDDEWPPPPAGRIVSLSSQQHPQRPSSGTTALVRLDPSNTLYTGQLREEGIL
jgi:flavin reductase (DIM6/NTAB) family NADH-FMN oxidoreductase RutF